jgi:hypothetical protein
MMMIKEDYRDVSEHSGLVFPVMMYGAESTTSEE